MSLLSKLLGIWAVGKSVSSTTPLFMRLLLGMAAITLFAVFAAVLMAFIMTGLVWVSYVQLLAHGITQLHAILIIGAVLVAILGIALLALRHYWRKACRLSKRIMFMQSPLTGRLNQISEAFMSGLRA